MTINQILIAVLIASFSATSLALPIYTGDTDAHHISNRSLQSGYTIWNDTGANDQNWHIRWTSKQASDTRNVDWYGNIVFQNALLDTVETYRFEQRGRHGDAWGALFDAPTMGFEWTSRTNNKGGVDGFDFTLQEGFEVLVFELGSSLFSDLDIPPSTANSPYASAPGNMIYIGSQQLSPQVQVFADGNQVYQSFKISPVPEPATIALIGIGLLGLGLARHVQNKSQAHTKTEASE